MARRLSRRSKDLVCMRQLARCGYCNQQLCDAFEVDHVNEDRTDDRHENLVATCALCHAIKSRHVRLKRNWEHMKHALNTHLHEFRDRWRCGAGWSDLPAWLQLRLARQDAHLYAHFLTAVPHPALVLNKFYYTGPPKPTYRTGS